MTTEVEDYLVSSGGRRGCPHPAHRFAQVPGSPARLILPECAGRDAWLAARREGIGGSEVGALIGVNEYDTAVSVWNTKKNGGKDLSALAAVEWGHRLEDVVAEKTAEEIGMVSRFAGGLWADRENPILRVTPDRFATEPRKWKAKALIECKTAGDDEHWESGVIHPSSETTGSAPLSYQGQAQWQMGIIGLPVCYLGCYVSNMQRDFFVVEVHFNADWFAEMVNSANRFWTKNVLGDEIPLHDYRHPHTEELIKKLQPKVVRPSTDLPPEAEEWLKDLDRLKKRAADAQTDLDEALNFFRAWTGDAGAAYLGEEKIVSYPEVTSRKVSVGKLREQFPEVAEAVTETSSYRRMTVRVPKRFKS